jgi:hypothetical protein
MACKTLKPTYTKDFMGITIHLNDGNDKIVIADNLDFNPVKGRNLKLKTGYMFRYPDSDLSNISSVMKYLVYATQGYNWWFIKDSKSEKITGYVLFADRDEATMFAFSHMSTWQKWSQAQESEELELKSRNQIILKLTKTVI